MAHRRLSSYVVRWMDQMYFSFANIDLVFFSSVHKHCLRCSCRAQLLNLKGHIEALSGADRKQTRKQSSPTYAEHWKHCKKENLKNHALHHDRKPMELIFLCLNSCQRNNKKLHNACNFLLKHYINLKMLKYTPVFVCVLVLRFCRALPCRGR